MSEVLFDSNIVIDLINGVPAAAAEWRRYPDPAISVVTCIEVMAGTSSREEKTVRRFIEDFARIELTPDIAERSAVIRRERRIKLPDAIIQASAEAHRLLLVTRNERDFPDDMPGVRVPYRL